MNEETFPGSGPRAAATAVDINSLDEYNDVEEVDPNASTFDLAPPPPEGDYTIAIKAVPNAVDKSKQVDGARLQGSVGGFILPARGERPMQRHLYIVLDHAISDEGKPWNGQSRREWINTMKDDQLQTTPVDTYLKLTTGNAGIGLSNGQKVLKLYDKLAVGEVLVRGTIQWILEATEDTAVLNKKTGEQKFKGDGTPKTERKIFLYGMRRFPVLTDSNGQPLTWPDGTQKHRALEEDPTTGAPARTRWHITKLLPLAQAIG